ncbi:MAG: hypothetical protein ACREXY_13870 [Gammaproteobacteria bacterium]
MRLGLDALVPTQRGYLSGQVGLTPREAFLRGELGYKFVPSVGAFLYGERRVDYLDPWRNDWDAGVGVKWSF